MPNKVRVSDQIIAQIICQNIGMFSQSYLESKIGAIQLNIKSHLSQMGANSDNPLEAAEPELQNEEPAVVRDSFISQSNEEIIQPAISKSVLETNNVQAKQVLEHKDQKVPEESESDIVNQESNIIPETQRAEGDGKRLEEEMNMSWQISPMKRTITPSVARSDSQSVMPKHVDEPVKQQAAILEHIAIANDEKTTIGRVRQESIRTKAIKSTVR